MDTVLLLGLGLTALSALNSLAEEFKVVGVVRDAALNDPGNDEVVNRARELGIPLLTDVSVAGVRRQIAETQPACVVVSSYNRVLPADLTAQGRFVNVHYAPLPEYRGRANVNWAIINGERDAGISIHVLAAGLDAGNILYQQRVPIGPADTVTDLYERLNAIQARVLGETVKKYIAGYEGAAQDNSAATYGCGRVPEDGEIDWSGSTQQIYALVRALTRPYPGAFTYLGTRPMYILRATPVQEAPRYVGRIPGRIIRRSVREGYVDALTGDGVLRIHEVRFGDSDPVPASECMTSTKLTLGLRISDLLARIEALEDQIKRL
jgi:methionyl-tRNA formyltransferase